jgi:hypothetical protein
VKELEQLRSQRASSGGSGVVFNLSNNQAPLSNKLKSRRGRYRHGTTLPQGGREATRQEMMHAYQRYQDRAQAQAQAEDRPSAANATNPNTSAHADDGPTASDKTNTNPTYSLVSSSNQPKLSSNNPNNSSEFIFM